jgi:hypothetical protein
MNLVLVDVENVLHSVPEAIGEAARFNGRVSLPNLRSKPDTVVVLAFNTRLPVMFPSDIRPTVDWVQKFAAYCVSKCNLEMDTSVLELAIVLPRPQAADDALVQLLDSAPIGHQAGLVEQVHLFSFDNGLRARLQLKLGRPSARRGDSHHAFVKCSLRRKGPPPAAVRRFLPEQWSAAASDSGVPGTLDYLGQNDGLLEPLCSAIMKRGHVPSQLSVTRRSVAGVGRMLNFFSGNSLWLSETLSQWGPLDYTESRTKDTPPDKKLGTNHAAASPIDPGVVRLETAGVTAKTALPWYLVEAGRAPLLSQSRELGCVVDDGRVIANIGPGRQGVFPATERLAVSFALSRSGRIKVAIEDEHFREHWWWSGAAKSEQYLDLRGISLRQRAQVEAVPLWMRGELVFSAPRELEGTCVLAADVPANTLVLGVVNGTYCMLWSRHGVGYGTNVKMELVQRSVEHGSALEALQRFPVLMVSVTRGTQGACEHQEAERGKA